MGKLPDGWSLYKRDDAPNGDPVASASVHNGLEQLEAPSDLVKEGELKLGLLFRWFNLNGGRRRSENMMGTMLEPLLDEIVVLFLRAEAIEQIRNLQQELLRLGLQEDADHVTFKTNKWTDGS